MMKWGGEPIRHDFARFYNRSSQGRKKQVAKGKKKQKRIINEEPPINTDRRRILLENNRSVSFSKLCQTKKNWGGGPSPKRTVLDLIVVTENEQKISPYIGLG